MDPALRQLIERRLRTTPPAGMRAVGLVRAACDGALALAAALDPDGGGAQPAPLEPASGTAAHPAYLRSITVEGFRGVGPEVTLTLAPGPGLTLVTGRNGSGKSSFAEALEILLTGRNLRWEGRSQVWSGAWRNLHHPRCRVSAEFAVEGVPTPQRLVRSWEPAAALDQSRLEVRGTVGGGLAGLGWERAVAAHRPLLTHNEVGTRLDARPSDLHDALAGALGLEDLSVAVRLLSEERLARERERRAAEESLAPLRARLLASPDERARVCLAHLTGPEWDLAGLDAVLGTPASGDADSPELGILTALSRLAFPPADTVAAAAGEVEEAIAQVGAVAGTDADRARRTARLLEEALDLHSHHGDGDCPVCGRPGALDAAWRTAGEVEAGQLRGEAEAADRAHRWLAAAVARARALIAPAPAVLGRAPEVGLSSEEVAAAWREWEAPPSAPEGLAHHLRARHGGLSEAVARLAASADAEVTRRQDVWRPLARELTVWAECARRAEARAEPAADIRRAEQWIKSASADLREERFRPIADLAQRNWSLLRQQSSVEVGGIRLEGASAQRRVALDVTVDGEAGPALGIMSQGELNCLSLSLFLPRALLPESPFRFVVIDDPVQAMDPAKVDGLARCLQESARDRQVVVLSHDTRLPAAIRHLGIPATVLEVTRREASAVEVRTVIDPVAQLVDDALAVAATQEENPHAGRVVPGICRAAIEAACMRVLRTRRLRQGRSHEQIEAEFDAVTTVNVWMALVMLDDPRAGHQALDRARARFGEREASAFERSRRGAHGGDSGDLMQLARDTERLTRRVLDLA